MQGFLKEKNIINIKIYIGNNFKTLCTMKLLLY